MNRRNRFILLAALSATSLHPDVVVKTKDGKVHRIAIDPATVVSIEFIPEAPTPTPTPTPTPQSPSIDGEWVSDANIVYTIRQNGSKFSWHAEKIHENATGTINGSSLSASWSGDWGSHSATGSVVAASNGKATKIKFSNGAVFSRVK